MRTQSPEKKALLQETAIRLIVEEGFDGFSLHKLARATGTSAGNVYTYFEHKLDLLARCYSDAEQKAATAAMQHFEPDMGLQPGLWLQWQNRYKHIKRWPLEFRFTEQFRNSPLVARQQNDFQSAMQAFVKRCVEKGELVKIPDEVYWSLAYGPFYTLIKFHLHRSNMAGKPFALSPTLLKQTFDRVLLSLS